MGLRMKWIRRIIWFLAILLLIMGVTIFYAFKIETKKLVTKEYNLDYSWSEAPEELTIVQFSDVHLSRYYDLEQLRKIVDRINAQKPDLVLFTGDLIDVASEYDHKEVIGAVLGDVEASLGKYAVWGNHDYGGGGIGHYRQIMEESGFTILVNESVKVPYGSGKIMVTGLDDGLFGAPYMYEYPDSYEEDIFRIFMLHEPDLIEDAPEDTAELILAGHSHGGQIRLPYAGPLYRTVLAKEYVEGMYDTGQGKLYVNTGLGTTKIHARLFNPPMIAVFHVKLF